MTEWWSPGMGGMVGGLGGTLMGLGGAAVGTLGGVCAPRGRLRRFTLGVCWALVAIGAAMLAGAIVALVGGQPYHVWYPLGLPGVVGIGVFTMMALVLTRVYRQADARRLDAEQFRRS